MTDIKSMNEQELRKIVLSQSEAIVKLINQLEAQETLNPDVVVYWKGLEE